MLRYTVRPLTNRHEFPGKHSYSDFSATWSDTLDVLEREIAALRGREVVIEVDVDERGIRNDGMLRSDARAKTPAVRIAFESKHGPLQYATDIFIGRTYRSRMESWQHNVRAIALGLEALRKVDRYGISRSGEQYRGYKALPPGIGLGATHMTQTDAIAVLAAAAGCNVGELWEDRADNLADLHRLARFKAHPDRLDGDQTAWDQVEQAARVLGLAS